MSEKRPAQFHATFNTSENEGYWFKQFENDPPWLKCHPLREHIRMSMGSVSPFRIFGDETGVSKNCERPVSCLTWDADISQGDVWMTKLPVYVIPRFYLLPDGVTLGPLDEVAVWSWNQLSLGRWPIHDHNGQAFKPGSFRGKRAGQPLTRDGRSGAFVCSTSDWDWTEKTYKFGANCGADEICWICGATQHDTSLHTDYCRFQRLLEKSHAVYMASIGRHIPLCGIVGWHKSLVIPELMHSGPLGCLHYLNGSALKILTDTPLWGNGGDMGSWKDKLDCKLPQP